MCILFQVASDLLCDHHCGKPSSGNKLHLSLQEINHLGAKATKTKNVFSVLRLLESGVRWLRHSEANNDVDQT